MKQIHVVAGVIRDARGRVLLARRTRGRDLAGLWEFPGGKVEPGETPEAALARELHEELGIRAVAGEPLIRVPQQYPDKRLVLDVRQVQFTGTPKGLDGQALVWSPPEKLARYPMPPADRPVVAALLQPDRYLVTPEPGEDDHAWLHGLARALEDGVRRVQLRARTTGPARWVRLAEQAAALCREAGAEVLVNGDAALARQLGAGLHLRATQLQQRAAAQAGGDRPRRDAGRGQGPIQQQSAHPLEGGRGQGPLQEESPQPSKGTRERGAPPHGEPRPLAASCHGLDDLLHAQALDCDFVVLGPVMPTASHPGAPGLGWDAFAQAREHASLPIYALGGLQPGDLSTARAHGAQGIAAIRGLWNSTL